MGTNSDSSVNSPLLSYSLAVHNSSVCIDMIPTENLPARPVSLAPPSRGTISPSLVRPILRLKKGSTSGPLRLSPPPPEEGPQSNTLWFSRKKSLFSGKNRLNLVRLVLTSSTSTCEKSVFRVASKVNWEVTDHLNTSTPASGITSQSSRSFLTTGTET